MTFKLTTVSICAILLALSANAGAAVYPLSYGGRLTNNQGKPHSGEVVLRVEFFRTPEDGTALPVAIPDYNHTLQDGIFELVIDLADTDFHTVFNGTDPVWIQVTDVTRNKSFPRQKFGAVPYALKVPVDSKTLSYDADGRLTVGPTGAPGANQFLTKDGSGNLVYGTPASNPGTVTAITAGTGLTGGTINGAGTLALADPLPAISGANLTNVNAVKLQGTGVAVTTPSIVGQVLKWDGTNWSPGTDATLGSGAITDGVNLGATGAGYADIFESAVAPDLRFRRLKSGTGVTVTQNADDVTINSTITQYSDAAATAAAVQAGVITDAVTKAPTHDAVFDALAGKAAASHTHAVTDVGGGTIDATEFGHLDGVTSNIQTQLTGKAAAAHLHAASDIGNGDVSNFQLSTLTGATSNIQTQLDAKQAAINAGARLSADLVGDGSVTTAEFGYINSLTGNAQAQLDGKHPTINAGARLNADLVGDGTVSTTELSYINSLSSNAQTQLNAKQATLTTASALDVASVATNAQGGLTLKPFGVTAGDTGELRFNDLAAGGTFAASIKAPDTLAAGYTLTLPTSNGNNLDVLQTDGNGVLSWVPQSAGGGVTSVAGDTGAVVLDAADVAPTATRLWLSNTDKASYDTAAADALKWNGGATGLVPATARTSLGLVIGTNVQAQDAALQSIADLTTANDQMIYATGADTYTTTGLTSYGRALIDDTSVAAQHLTLGLGTMASQNASAVAITGGTIAGTTFTTPSFSNDAISGDKIHGGTISTFASTGIDDNADALAVTINSLEQVGIGTAPSGAPLHVLGSGSGAAPAVSGSTDATMNQRVCRGTVCVDNGMMDNGNGYLQVRQYNNFAVNHGLALNPNGGNISMGSATALGQLSVTNTVPAQAGLVVRGAAAQTGNLQEWQNSAGTVVASISSAGVPSFAMSGGGIINGIQRFTATGASTFTVPAGVTKVFVEVWGGGGGGAEYTTNGGSAGGSSSFGGYCSTTGGAGGTTAIHTNAAGGAGSGGAVNLTGQAGAKSGYYHGNPGGSAPRGGGAGGAGNYFSYTAVNGMAPGGGGGGAGYIGYGSGGGAGGYCANIVTGLTPGGTVAVTVGTGGSGGGNGGDGARGEVIVSW